MADISKITIPVAGGGTATYDIKDAVARAAIVAGFTYHVATNASDTPEGVKWEKDGVVITGTLVASADTLGFYLVPTSNTETGDVYDEYLTIVLGTVPETYAWEKLGSTAIDFDNLAGYLDTQVNLTKDVVLGEGTTFTNESSAVSFSGGTNDTFVKSYPGVKNRLETTELKGVGSDITFNAVSVDPGTVTATNTILGTATTASKVVTETKEATKVVFGNNTTASLATAGTAVVLAKPASTATNVSYIGNSGTNSVLATATVSNETLNLGAVSVAQNSVTGINGSQNIIPYTFSDVTVPVVESTTSVSVASVKTNTDVTVPVISSNNPVTASGQITLASKTAATSASDTTTVATGSLNSSDTVGAEIMTGLGNATTASAVTNIGTGTAAAQHIIVGTADKVNAVTGVDVTIINKASN